MKNHTRSSATALAAALALGAAHAGSISLANGGEISYGFTANYGLAKRLEAPAAQLTANPLTDDGNRNFKKGAIINNRISLLGEADWRYASNQGIFLRAQALYDHAYRSSNDHDSPGTRNGSGAPNSFPAGTRSAAGSNAKFIDAYWYGNFDTGNGGNLGLKLGRHVVSWGEAMFFANMAAAQGPVDVDKINVPGAQVKDFLLPVGQISANYTVNDRLALMGYYQLEFRETQIPSVGSFFSTVDFLGRGGETFLPGLAPNPTPRGADIKARKSGQWGIGTRYSITPGTSLGLYYAQYHQRTPSLQLNGAPGTPGSSYQVRYQENIKLLGSSLSTKLGDVSVGAEATYKTGTPLWVLFQPGQAGNYNSFTNQSPRGSVLQTQVNFTYAAAPNSLVTGETFLIGEIANQRIVRNQSGLELAAGKNATALALMAIPSYPNIINGWDLKIPMTWMQFLQGGYAANCTGGCAAQIPSADSLTLLGPKEKRFSIGAEMTYLGNLQVGLTLNKFLGGANAQENPLADRDNLALKVSYSF